MDNDQIGLLDSLKDNPSVVYDLDADPIPVTVEWKPLRAALTTDAGLNALIDLHVDGEVTLTIAKKLQHHPIRDDVLHIDFLRVNANAEITVEVPIILKGETKTVLNKNNTTNHLLHALSINAKPTDIPNEITVNISNLEINKSIHTPNIALPKSVSTDVNPKKPTTTNTQATVAEEPTENKEGAEAAEGSDAPTTETETSAEGSDEG